jgi:hypothetical protein
VTSTGTPAAIKQQFSNTFIGIHAAWIILGVLEFGVFAILVVSVHRPQIRPVDKPWWSLPGGERALAWAVFGSDPRGTI